ncbi:winged helix-turn helix domain-containing protein [Ditylenchus destructor]|uniref:Winged helix-turn helix domain-containing protein n=1 Tax=Ditylenchus destructor TaxID=166010 RepID=A0AAD4R1W7_9BILA|nr:winged helix-turn helix domain-containing protein [Ditylenchus destructor]
MPREYLTYLSLAENCLVLLCITSTTIALTVLFYRLFFKPNLLVTRTFSKPMLIFLSHHLLNSIFGFFYHFYLVIWWRADGSTYSPYVLFRSGFWVSNYWAINPVAVFFLTVDRCLAIVLSNKYGNRAKSIVLMLESVTLAGLYVFSTCFYFLDLPLDLSTVSSCQSFPCLLIKFRSVPQLAIKMTFGWLNILASALFFYLIKNVSYNISNRVVVVSVVFECVFNTIPGCLSFLFTMVTGDTWTNYLGPIGSTLVIVDAACNSLMLLRIFTAKDLFILFIIKMSSKRAAIIELYKQGQGVNNIARLLKMHKQSVIRAVSRFKELGTLEDRPRSGRPPDVRVQKAKKAIKAKLRRNPKRSMRMLAKEGEISNRTVRRLVNDELRNQSLKLQETTALTEEHKEERLKRCKRLLRRFTECRHREILFSDESYFLLQEGFNKQNTRIIAATREEANAYGRLVERSQFPKTLMVWGGICWNGKTPLVIFEPRENVNAKNYKEKVLLPLNERTEELDTVVSVSLAALHTVPKPHHCMHLLPSFVLDLTLRTGDNVTNEA